jgi:pimeloyl-ACP methyl ester carboxylesterase
MMLAFFIIFIIISAALILLKTFCYTPHIKNGISEIRKIKIGGIDQYILVRGENTNNPILLYLHGGPGTTELIPFRLFHRKLEKYFTVVVWEQRGTGKSFSTKIPKESMKISQFVSDAHELTEYLLKEFNQEKIVVAGHSWGSALGLLLIHRYPNLFYAYVGSGQLVNPQQGELIGYRFLLDQAKSDKKTMEELTKLNYQKPYLTIDDEGNWFKKLKIQRRYLVAFGGEIHRHSDYGLLFSYKTMFAPEYTWLDFIKFGSGSLFSLKEVWPEVMKLDLVKQVPQVEVPIFILQGRYDYNTPSILVEQYFNNLKAPIKELIWFEDSGHHPMYEEPEKYDEYLIEKILPLCK